MHNNHQKGGKKIMFGKKKNEKPMKVMHYEGIDAFATDYPCTLELKDGQLVITRIKPFHKHIRSLEEYKVDRAGV